jgi:hypothetical protein
LEDKEKEKELTVLIVDCRVHYWSIDIRVSVIDSWYNLELDKCIQDHITDEVSHSTVSFFLGGILVNLFLFSKITRCHLPQEEVLCSDVDLTWDSVGKGVW